jgi:hypothetical protein
MSGITTFGDSVVTLLFDGLEIIRFKDVDHSIRTAEVLLPRRDDHVPNLDILKISGNIPTPVPHTIDITRGIEIKLEGKGSKGIIRRKGSFDKILNLQSDAFHAGNLKFKEEAHHGAIKVEITDGEFYSAVETIIPLDRFEVTGKLKDLRIEKFADLVGVDISLKQGSVVVITDNDARNKPVSLPHKSGTRYVVLIKNHPVPGHHSLVSTHPEPNRREVTHFYFYYDLLDDKRPGGPRFDFAVPKGGGVPPQNCDPVLIEPSN